MATKQVTSLVVQAEYGAKESFEIFDPTLIKHTENIMGFQRAKSKAVIGVCAELARMSEDESYKQASFKSVAEYGLYAFGFKRATSNMYVAVGKAFTEGSGRGVKLKEGLPSTLSAGQMIELLPLVSDNGDITEAVDAFVTGKVNDRMSTKAMREAVKAIRSIPMKEAPQEAPQEAPKSCAELFTEYYMGFVELSARIQKEVKPSIEIENQLGQIEDLMMEVRKSLWKD